MSWGALYMYYKCPKCGLKFKYATDLIPQFGDDFGHCPDCGEMGTFVRDGARTPDDLDWREVE